MITEEQIRVCKQKKRIIHIRIEVLNEKDNVLDRIDGLCLDGNIDIDLNSYIQRTCNLKLKLSKKLLPNEESLIWTNKRFKLNVGIKDLLTDKIIWFNQGFFIYQDTDITYSNTENTLSIKGLDKMCRFSGQFGGTLMDKVKITPDITLTEAIRGLVIEEGKENKFLIDDIVDDYGKLRLVPYIIDKSIGDNLLDLLKELVEMYKYETMYYNTKGYFVCEHTKTLLNDPIFFNFDDNIDYTILHQVQNDFSYIKNRVKVIGAEIQPFVSVEDIPSVDNENPKNNETELRITFNKPLYNSKFERIKDKEDITNLFEYNGNISNYTKAIYNSEDYSVLFSIKGEQGKILRPREKCIYDVSQLPFDDGGYVYSDKDKKWTKLINTNVILDGINNSIKFKLQFNKPLYNKDGNAFPNNADMKEHFTYTEDGSNWLEAKYIIDDLNDCYIEFKFEKSIENSTIRIKENSIFDSAGLSYTQDRFILNGGYWIKISSIPLVDFQIIYEMKNEDRNNKYSIPNIGERCLVIKDEKIYTIEQAKMRCQYELETHSNLNEKLILNCIPLYFLEVNKLIQFTNKKIGVENKYKINRISFGLKTDSQMSLECSNIYI